LRERGKDWSQERSDRDLDDRDPDAWLAGVRFVELGMSKGRMKKRACPRREPYDSRLRTVFLQRRDIDERLTATAPGGPLHADENAVAVLDDSDAVA
jgi:hypothetical protein